MIIRTKIKNSYTQFSWQLKDHARRVILAWPMRATEIALDNYLKNNYNTSLKIVGMNLLLNSSISTDGEFLVTTFKDIRYDKIASFITYGNSEVSGCNMIRDAFRWKE